MNEADIQALLEATKLKSLNRAGWLRCAVAHPESVAAHSWGVAWLVLLLCPSGLNRERALELALVHDLAEVRAGDITPYDKVSATDKHRLEEEALQAMMGECTYKACVTSAFEEYRDALTPEAKFVHYCDKLDMALQARRYMLDNPELNLREFIETAQRAYPDIQI